MTADPLLPRPPEGLGTGALLALAVHAALVAALAASVNWHAQVPATISAELWASLPQIAAPKGLPPAPTPVLAPPAAAPAVEKPSPPRPEPTPVAPPVVPPTPKPPDPQIAIEQARKEAALRADRQAEADAARARELKLTQERELKERLQREAHDQQVRDAKARAQAQRQLQQKQSQQQALAQAAARELQAAQAEDARLAKLREDNLRRMREQIGAPDASGGKGATGTAARDAAPSPAYSGRLAALIREAIVYTGSTPDNAAAEVEVRAAPGGSIISRRLLKSSGHPEWDEAVLRAIDRLGTLPADRDGRVPATLIVSHRPHDQEPVR